MEFDAEEVLNVRSSVLLIGVTFNQSYCLQNLLSFSCDNVNVIMSPRLVQNRGKTFKNTLNKVYEAYREMALIIYHLLRIRRTAKNLHTKQYRGTYVWG